MNFNSTLFQFELFPLVDFYTPEVKLRTYNGMASVCLFVRPSVCLSVR